jgi:hypothetical protein
MLIGKAVYAPQFRDEDFHNHAIGYIFATFSPACCPLEQTGNEI